MKLRTLIVEDDLPQAEALEYMLQHMSEEQLRAAGIEGVELTKADCVVAARQALAQAVEAGRPFDLLLLDLGLPETPGRNEAADHGVEILRRARELDIVKGTIIISAFTDLDHSVPAFQLGAVDFIGKNYHHDEVLLRVLRAWNEIKDRQRHRVLSDIMKAGLRELAPYADKGITYRLSSCFSKLVQSVRREAGVLQSALLEQFALAAPDDLPATVGAPLTAFHQAIQTAKEEWKEIQQPLQIGGDARHALSVEEAIVGFAEKLRPCVAINLLTPRDANTRILSFQDACQDNALIVLQEVMVGGLADLPAEEEEARLWQVDVSIERQEGMAEISFKDNFEPLSAEHATTIQHGGAVAPREGQWRAWGLSVVSNTSPCAAAANYSSHRASLAIRLFIELCSRPMSRFLVVDNSTADTALIKSLLDAAGEQAEVCADYATACRVARTGDSFSCAFLLWDFADVDFHDLLKLFRAHSPEARIFALLDELLDNFADLATRALRLGAEDVLAKPLQHDGVVRCLQPASTDMAADALWRAKLGATIRGQSPTLVTVLRKLARVIQHGTSDVLLLGESGTGKELFAQAVHEHGPHPNGPFIRQQISAIPAESFENELFGHEPNSFTGVKFLLRGLFERAHGGTLLLDEIGVLPDALQFKLLRALQERVVTRLGGTRPIPFETRVIFATSSDLAAQVEAGHFRRDLYYRIKKAEITVPPLRERKGDAVLLAQHFVTRFSPDRQLVLTNETIRVLQTHAFPGNVRELESAIENAVTHCQDGRIRPSHLELHSTGPLPTPAAERAAAPSPASPSATETPVAPPPTSHLPAELFEHLTERLPANWLRLPHTEVGKRSQQAIDRVYLKASYQRHHGNITQAARALEMDPKTFRARWKLAALPPLRGEENHPDDETPPTDSTD